MYVLAACVCWQRVAACMWWRGVPHGRWRGNGHGAHRARTLPLPTHTCGASCVREGGVALELGNAALVGRVDLLLVHRHGEVRVAAPAAVKLPTARR